MENQGSVKLLFYVFDISCHLEVWNIGTKWNQEKFRKKGLS